MPTAFYSFITYHGAWPAFVVNYLLVLLAVFSLYELGYILNDTIAIHKEEQPAVRLYPHNFEHFSHYRHLIVLARFCYALIALALLYWIDASRLTIPQVTNILAVPVIFAIYNSWRSKQNVWLYPVLVFSRYLPFMLLYNIDGWAILMLFVSFPLVNMMERFSMPQYRFPVMRKLIPTEESKTVFRLVYYLAVMWLPLLLPLPITKKYIYMIPLEILCFYRLMLYFIVKHRRPTNYLNG